MRPRVNLAGIKREGYEVLEFSGSKMSGETERGLWKCKCLLCQKEFITRQEYIKQNRIRSCGCLRFKSGSNHRDWGGYGEISLDQYGEIEHCANKRRIKFDVSIKYLWELFLLQNRKCLLTGDDLYLNGPKRKRGNASVDRIDNSKPYKEGNVRWVTRDANLVKRTMTDNELVVICRKIINRYENNSNSFTG